MTTPADGTIPCNIRSVLALTVTCGTNDKNEIQKPIYTLKENDDFVFSTTDTLYALQALLNRIS